LDHPGRVPKGIRKVLLFAHKNERGLTLIEVLIALAIVAIVAGVFVSGLSTTSKSVMVSQERVAVDSLARFQMEDAKNQPYEEEATTYPLISIPTDLISQGYGLSVLAEPLNSPDDGIQKITVTVTRNGSTVFTLVDYKANLEGSS
jgi:prepilin-type N-terminal cleavage/methylation domain-containing protein